MRFGGARGRIGNDDIESGLKASSAYPSVVSAIGEPIAVSRGAWAVSEGDAIMQSRIPRGSCRQEVHDGGPRMAPADILYPPLAFGQWTVRAGSRSRVRDPIP